MGRLLGRVEAWLEAAASRDPDAPRLVLLSGHDSTLVPLLAALQVGMRTRTRTRTCTRRRTRTRTRRQNAFFCYANLQLFDATWSWPPYAAHLRIELGHARRGGAPAARMLYQGHPLSLSPPADRADRADRAGRAGWVGLEVFRALLRPSRLTDSEYEAECARPEAAAAEEAAEQSEGETGADASLRNTLLAPPPRSRM